MHRSRPARLARLLLAAILAGNLLWLELTLAHGSRFGYSPVGTPAMGILGALLFGAAITALLHESGGRHRRARAAIVAVALLASVRFHLPMLLLRYASPPASASRMAPALVAELRELSAAQEQYRLTHGRYASTRDSLARWLSPAAPHELTLTSRGAEGWTATGVEHRVRCTISVSAFASFAHGADMSGTPECGRSRASNTAYAAPAASPCKWTQEVPAIALGGTWLQHRGNALRTGAVDGASDHVAHSWSTQLCGVLRAPAAIAGGQVFVGAHGNGELAALSLATGQLQFRVRTPNWIHHEPVVTDSLVIIGFGNNERNATDDRYLGSPPSGVAAYDRRTGVERWRHYTVGSVMTSPVASDSLVAVVTGAREVTAWHIRDGAPAWHAALSGFVPMGNPLLLDGRLIVGVESTTVCAFEMRSGMNLYCTPLAQHGWGAGHASIAAHDSLALATYLPPPDSGDRSTVLLLSRILGIPVRDYSGLVDQAQMLVAFDPRDGREYWRLELGHGRTHWNGHVAGTPVIVGEIAYVPLPVSGEVVAVGLKERRVLWRAEVSTARGSLYVGKDVLFAATQGAGYVVLDASTGRQRCRGTLAAASDRAGLTASGQTGLLDLESGLVLARPLAEWFACRT